MKPAAIATNIDENIRIYCNPQIYNYASAKNARLNHSVTRICVVMSVSVRICKQRRMRDTSSERASLTNGVCYFVNHSIVLPSTPMNDGCLTITIRRSPSRKMFLSDA